MSFYWVVAREQEKTYYEIRGVINHIQTSTLQQPSKANAPETPEILAELFAAAVPLPCLRTTGLAYAGCLTPPGLAYPGCLSLLGVVEVEGQ